MVDGVRSVLRSNWDTFVHLDLKRTIKVAARFVHNKPEEMKRVFDKAKARNEARKAVHEAIGRLKEERHQKKGDRVTDLFREILEEVRAARPEGKLGDRDFQVAVNDEAWKKSVEAHREKPIFLLKRRGDDPGRDGTRALKSDLHKKAKGDFIGYATAVDLTALLDEFKGREVRGELLLKVLDRYSETLKDLALCLPVDFYNSTKSTENPREITKAFMSAYKKHFRTIGNSGDSVSDFIGKAATKFLHPRLETALEAARQCPILNNHRYTLDHEYILKLFQDYFEVFSSPEIWSHKETKQSLCEYYGIALSIAALEKLRQRASFSKEDIELLKSTLKGGQIPDLDAINLKAKPDIIWLQMSKVVADHYIEDLNFDDYGKKPAVMAQIENTTNADDVITALKDAFGEAIKKKIERDRFFEPLEDFAARHGAT